MEKIIEKDDTRTESPKPRRNVAAKVEQKKEESSSEEEVVKSEDK